jgi:DNA repair protein RadD
VCAAHLMQEARRSSAAHAFVVRPRFAGRPDEQVFDDLRHRARRHAGDHWRCEALGAHPGRSAQTLARRGWKNGDLQLIVVDECHTLYKTSPSSSSGTRRHRRRPHRDAVQKGLGQIFTNVVNVATTDQLIAEGFLVPVKAYAGKAADMTGAKTKFDGEWAEDEMEKRGITIIGDIVSEWIAKTRSTSTAR